MCRSPICATGKEFAYALLIIGCIVSTAAATVAVAAEQLFRIVWRIIAFSRVTATRCMHHHCAAYEKQQPTRYTPHIWTQFEEHHVAEQKTTAIMMMMMITNNQLYILKAPNFVSQIISLFPSNDDDRIFRLPKIVAQLKFEFFF